MLKEGQAEMLGKVLPQGLTVEVLTKALTSESEVDLEIPTGRFLTADNEATLLDNHGKKKYDEGKTVGSEVMLKDLSKEAGFETAIKDSKEFLTQFKTNILDGAKIEPNKKVEELEASLESLRGVVTEKDTTINDLQSKITGISVNSKIKEAIPELKEGVNKDDVLTLFKASYSIKEDGVYKGDTLLKDDLQNPLTVEQSMSSFLGGRDWIKKSISGNGGKGKTGGSTGSIGSYSEFQKICESKGWNEGSAEAKQFLQNSRQANKNFDMDK